MAFPISARKAILSWVIVFVSAQGSRSNNLGLAKTRR